MTKKQLLWIRIQDGERSYDEYYLVDKDYIFKKDDYVDGFERDVKSYDLEDISPEEIKVLQKFGVF